MRRTLLLLTLLLSTAAASHAAPAPLPRREAPSRSAWCVGGWHAEEGRAVSASFSPDGSYREDWCGVAYVGTWERREGGWVSVGCEREGAEGATGRPSCWLATACGCSGGEGKEKEKR